MERTLVIIKPDGVKRGLIGEVLSRLEKRGFKITALKMIWLTEEQAQKLYEPHLKKDFYPGLLAFMISGPIVIMAVEGRSVIKIVRNMVGALNPEEALPGSIRGDYSLDMRHTVIHASDSQENAVRELSLFFSDFIEYETSDEKILYSVKK
ncbi:nucleoside-diphosphate kinase [Candidatus Poribacteria bacterium]|nr:nucleoside-diphosphate kinase [Candidatus Poribacteria bacterium]